MLSRFTSRCTTPRLWILARMPQRDVRKAGEESAEAPVEFDAAGLRCPLADGRVYAAWESSVRILASPFS